LHLSQCQLPLPLQPHAQTHHHVPSHCRAGNKYSTNHTHLDVRDRPFWEFSYDDMALSDLPAEVDYVTAVTGAPQISYVGHSEGTIQAFAGLSRNKTLAAKVRVFVALAPVAHVFHVETAFLQLMCKLDLDEIFVLFGDKSFLPSDSVIAKIAPGICKTLPLGCADVLELVVGPARNINDVRRRRLHRCRRRRRHRPLDLRFG
jgi:pimeloyl-ACP methyl ester carboxylesterase